MELQRWQVISMEGIPSSHTRFIEIANWGQRLVTVDQSGQEVHSTDWNRSVWKTPLARLDFALRHYGVALDDDVNSLAGIHTLNLKGQRYSPHNPVDTVSVRIWKREGSELYVWQATQVLNNGMIMQSSVSLGHGISQFALDEALEAFGTGYYCITKFNPEPEQE